MYQDNFNKGELVCIVINQEHRIKYSQIDIQTAHDYFQQLNIFDNLSGEFPIQYASGSYWVSIDRFHVATQPYFIITLTSKYYKCNNCSKALIDIATGLYNRNYWEQLNTENCYQSEDQRLFLIFIDIDNLKKMNDNYGHLVGDQAIKIVGEAIKKSIDKEDLGIRYGGDEFIILILNKEKEVAGKTIEKIRKEIKSETLKKGVTVDISAGVAYGGYSRSLEEMLEAADKELYKEKGTKEIGKTKKGMALKGLKKLKNMCYNIFKTIFRREPL